MSVIALIHIAISIKSDGLFNPKIVSSFTAVINTFSGDNAMHAPLIELLLWSLILQGVYYAYFHKYHSHSIYILNKSRKILFLCVSKSCSCVAAHFFVLTVVW